MSRPSSPRNARTTRQVIIRGFEPSDAEALAQIFQQPAVVAGTMRTPHESIAKNAAMFAADDLHRRILVATLDERVVGNISLDLERVGRRRHVAAIGMMVDESFHSRGIGGALLDAAIALAERWLHVQRLELDVHVDNVRGLALYRSRGFTIEGVARAFSLRDGVLVDAFRMARVGATLPYPRLTAEEAASRPPPALPRSQSPPTRRRKGGGGTGGSGTGGGGGWGTRGGEA